MNKPRARREVPTGRRMNGSETIILAVGRATKLHRYKVTSSLSEWQKRRKAGKLTGPSLPARTSPMVRSQMSHGRKGAVEPGRRIFEVNFGVVGCSWL